MLLTFFISSVSIIVYTIILDNINIKGGNFMSTLTFKIDEELKKEFKKICLEKDVTLTDVLTEFIQEYIEKNK